MYFSAADPPHLHLDSNNPYSLDSLDSLPGKDLMFHHLAYKTLSENWFIARFLPTLTLTEKKSPDCVNDSPRCFHAASDV